MMFAATVLPLVNDLILFVSFIRHFYLLASTVQLLVFCCYASGRDNLFSLPVFNKFSCTERYMSLNYLRNHFSIHVPLSLRDCASFRLYYAKLADIFKRKCFDGDFRKA